MHLFFLKIILNLNWLLSLLIYLNYFNLIIYPIHFFFGFLFFFILIIFIIFSQINRNAMNTLKRHLSEGMTGFATTTTTPVPLLVPLEDSFLAAYPIREKENHNNINNNNSNHNNLNGVNSTNNNEQKNTQESPKEENHDSSNNNNNEQTKSEEQTTNTNSNKKYSITQSIDEERKSVITNEELAQLITSTGSEVIVRVILKHQKDANGYGKWIISVFFLFMFVFLFLDLVFIILFLFHNKMEIRKCLFVII